MERATVGRRRETQSGEGERHSREKERDTVGRKEKNTVGRRGETQSEEGEGHSRDKKMDTGEGNSWEKEMDTVRRRKGKQS